VGSRPRVVIIFLFSQRCVRAGNIAGATEG